MAKSLNELFALLKYNLGEHMITGTSAEAAKMAKKFKEDAVINKRDINTTANNLLARPKEIFRQGRSASGDDFTTGKNGVPRTETLRDWLAPKEYKKNIFGGNSAFVEKGEYHYLTEMTDKELFDTLKSVLNKGSLFTEQAIVGKIISHFENGNGADFRETTSLSELMLGQSTYKLFLNETVKVFKEKMKLSKGDFGNINIGTASLKSLFPKGISYIQSPSLKTIVGGVQESKVYLTKMQYDFGTTGGLNFKYKSVINVVVYDDFGVSEDDIVNASFTASLGGRDGLIAFWMLQNQRGYKPFRNVFSFNIPANDTLSL